MASYTFTFNLFTVIDALRRSDPTLNESEIREAYDSLVALGATTPQTPLTPVQKKIMEFVTSQAKAQHKKRNCGGVG